MSPSKSRAKFTPEFLAPMLGKPITLVLRIKMPPENKSVLSGIYRGLHRGPAKHYMLILDTPGPVYLVGTGNILEVQCPADQ